MRLVDIFWPLRSTHRKLLQEGEETRAAMLKLAAASRNDTVRDVIVATDAAAEFNR